MIDAFGYRWNPCDRSPADPNPFMWRPMMYVRLLGEAGGFTSFGLVDSGAIETFVPMWMWEAIGPGDVHDDQGELHHSDGSSFPVVYASADLAVRISRQVYRWHAVVGFTEAREEIVLGDSGFLRFFSPTLNRDAKTLIIRRSSATLPGPNFAHLSPTGPMPRPASQV